MVKVKNLNGTGDNTPPGGYSSWKEWWESKKRRRFGICSCDDCSSRAEVGAHVQKVSSTDRSWYIVPLCVACNKKPKAEVFEVRGSDLEAANP
ncbi:Hypothetical protein DEACI_3964 [Acididesulfobacillus acetoxydans]|uniref:Uncharacterized protein n=1 Tax=Acididesulfobacillus acetoxydans TaxID=1561005 RepID=A0A8S0X1H3_9FIRM|nr:hypothetical protein [Acididesulfobacillus acetoxydans]CAA7603141.1 Hypothetical protein DEACI_3964 [Acididesulfobacillus acetoxydans]CEJ07631.1 Hypothetical protein DEACI_2097 [Acididesulfobacillus acetoxydans]